MHSPPANDFGFGFGFGLASVRIACLILAMRFRFKIRSLLVLTTLAGVIGAYYLSVQSGVKEEQRVLDEFKQQGIDLSVRNEPIVRDWSWNCIRQTINWPWHTMTGKDIPHCRGLILVVTDESARKTGVPAELVTKLRSCTNLQWVNWDGLIDSKRIAILNKLPSLSEIYLGGATLEGDIVGTLLESKKWKCLSFGKHQLSVKSFERLIDAGIEVEHYGLTDLTRESNFIEYDGVSYLADIDKTELSVYLVDTERYHFQYWLRLESRPDRYTQDIEKVRLSCQLDALHCKLGKLVGRKKSLSPKSPCMNDHYLENRGAWMDVAELSYKIVSRQANTLRIQGVFKLDDSSEAKVDAFFPVRKISVFLLEDDTSKDGARILTEAGFDPDHFEEPIYDSEYRELEFRFK